MNSPVDAAPRRPRVRQRMRTPQEARQWRRRMAGYGLIAASFLLVVNAVVGENGYLDTLRTRREFDEITNTLRRTREENLRLKEQLRRLHEDPGALEAAAREGLRMSLPGETVVVIKDAPSPPRQPAPPVR